jgi:hypothetical protein
MGANDGGTPDGVQVTVRSMIESAPCRLLPALILTALTAACGGSGGGGTGFSQVYSTIISSRCLPCHSVGTGATEGMLDMSSEQTAYSNLVGVKAKGLGGCSASGLTRVIPGSAQTSLLYEKVKSKLTQANPPCGDSMPDDDTTLSQAQVDLIETWIDDGAQM